MDVHVNMCTYERVCMPVCALETNFVNGASIIKQLTHLYVRNDKIFIHNYYRLKKMHLKRF